MPPETQPMKPMQSTQSLFAGYKLPTTKTRKLNPRQELIEQITCELNIDPKYRKGIYFTLLTDDELKQEWQKARSWKINPSALFNKNVRAKNNAIRNSLKNALL